MMDFNQVVEETDLRICTYEDMLDMDELMMQEEPTDAELDEV